jgi:hypothetical protein
MASAATVAASSGTAAPVTSPGLKLARLLPPLPLRSKNTVDPTATRSGAGGAVISIVATALVAPPPASVCVIVTVYVPGRAYSTVAFAPRALVSGMLSG